MNIVKEKEKKNQAIYPIILQSIKKLRDINKPPELLASSLDHVESNQFCPL